MNRKDIFKYSRQFIGGKSEVYAYYNSSKSKSIDIMISSETQYSEVNIYSTIGLSELNIGLESNNKTVGVELICIGDKGDELNANILASVAFKLMDMKDCFWGKIIPDAISQYDIKHDCKHVILLTPAFWNKYQQYETEDKIVAWLLLVPISNAEKLYIESNGVEAFEHILAQQKADITDRKRQSFVK